MLMLDMINHLSQRDGGRLARERLSPVIRSEESTGKQGLSLRPFVQRLVMVFAR